jgi:hypothetical protein
MKPWLRFLLCGLAGLALGAGFAVWRVQAGAFGSTVTIGPWTTGGDYGTAAASAYTRAVVARRGLLALPAREARYYNANVDDAGRPLDGRCHYRVSGGDPGGAWWSLTLYDADGFLVGNPAGVHSIPGGAVPAAQRGGWMIHVAPARQAGLWLPTGGIEHFELTLRVYLPPTQGRTNLPRERMPRIERIACR